ncbi:biopolymer transporter ExbD [Criblamydia sequanensis]|uniref:Biopolymer transport protein ExbD n=1 Tax=Candidatus Criblamydia sequanensis CRIB-18 TaxID=1437425 RepID=A0A090CXQ9_9BACT|nr:biopolymer transporter ExbD [Criblamydia sequanensis]CDR32887.1 putative biopolymer transport protein ExbD [Criblamydia sequanensis CRIB-18]
MKPFKTTLKTSLSLIDLTPLVDVIFLLLIFFIITSDILPFKTLNIENPKLDKDAIPLSTQLAVVMDRQNVIYLGSKKVIADLKSVKQELLQLIEAIKNKNGGKEPTLVLSVDKNVSYGSFLELYSIIEELASQVRLVFTPDENSYDYF